MHQELTKYFSIYLDGDSKSKWRWLLQDAAHAYNIAYHSALGASPFEILFGEKPSLGPLGVPTETKEVDNFPQYFGVRRRQLLQKRKMAQEAVDRAQTRMTALKNKHAHKIRFRVGDLVLYKNHVPKTKFDPKFKGPFQIVSAISPVVYEIEAEGRRFSVHAAYLKLYKTASTRQDYTQKEMDDIQSKTYEGTDHNPLEGEVVIRGPVDHHIGDYTFRRENFSFRVDDSFENEDSLSEPDEAHSRSFSSLKRLQSSYSKVRRPERQRPRFIKGMQKRLQRFIESSTPRQREEDRGRGRRELRRPVKYDDYEVIYTG
jgi:hypothetical protein